MSKITIFSATQPRYGDGDVCLGLVRLLTPGY
jgi:hypothetical protein